MDIKKLQLENIGRFKQLDIDFAPNVTVFIADNGGGKTTILKSLATVLSWLVNRIRTEKSSGSPIPLEVIMNESNSASVAIVVDNEEECFKWTVARSQKGRKGTHASKLEQCTKLAEIFRYNLTTQSDSSLPLLAFYSAERVVVDVPLRIVGRHSFGQVDGYDHSLTWGVDFRRFFEWFREREDKENENSIPQKFEQKIRDMLGENNDNHLWDLLKDIEASTRDKQLMAVRSAITKFMSDFDNLRVQRHPLRMTVEKAGEELNVLQLSQGEKSLMALVGDIARRLAIMNPNLKNPLEGDGVILIDEVDMHLHPKWQRSIVENLVNTFPNCQFILATHSPIVISDYKDILLYSIDAGGDIRVENAQYGKDVNMVLLGAMDTHIRNKDIDNKLNDLMDYIYDNKLSKAHALLKELENVLSESHLDIQTAKLLMRKQELRQELKHAKNKQG